MHTAEIGIIGGSGLYSMSGITEIEEVKVATPFGEPSDPLVLGTLEGRKVVFLARHGKGHRILPSELNFRANIYALKSLGCTSILSVSAVGSLKEEHKPTDFVIPDQFIDRTFARNATFFGDGLVGHVGFGDPVCPLVVDTFVKACEEVGVVGKRGGDICVYGGASVLDAGGVESISAVGSGCDWDDEPAGGEAGSGGGDELCDVGDGYGLRLLARRA